MRILYLTFSLFAACAPALQATGEKPADENGCRVSLNVFGKQIWQLDVTDTGIRGDVNRIKTEGGLVQGFLGGQLCRLKESNGRLDGSLAGKPAMFFIEKSAEHMKITGSLGDDRLIAEVSADAYVLGNRSLVVRLERRGGSGKPGTVRLVDKKGQVSLDFEGCRPTVAVGRPGLAVMLQQMVLARVAEFEDVAVQKSSADHK